jgi:protease-4
VNTQNAAPYSPFVPLNDKIKAVTLEGVEHIYNTFVTHVAEGRKMTLLKLMLLQGRVWAGSEAVKTVLWTKLVG